jgi:hypothetical protein
VGGLNRARNQLGTPRDSVKSPDRRTCLQDKSHTLAWMILFVYASSVDVDQVDPDGAPSQAICLAPALY